MNAPEVAALAGDEINCASIGVHMANATTPCGDQDVSGGGDSNFASTRARQCPLASPRAKIPGTTEIRLLGPKDVTGPYRAARFVTDSRATGATAVEAPW